MKEISLKLDVPRGVEGKVESAVERVLKEFLEEVKFSIARDILEESKLTEKQAKELAKEVNLSAAKRLLSKRRAKAF